MMGPQIRLQAYVKNGTESGNELSAAATMKFRVRAISRTRIELLHQIRYIGGNPLPVKANMANDIHTENG